MYRSYMCIEMASSFTFHPSTTTRRCRLHRMNCTCRGVSAVLWQISVCAGVFLNSFTKWVVECDDMTSVGRKHLKTVFVLVRYSRLQKSCNRWRRQNSGKTQLIYHVWIWLSFLPQHALPLCSSTINQIVVFHCSACLLQDFCNLYVSPAWARLVKSHPSSNRCV